MEDFDFDYEVVKILEHNLEVVDTRHLMFDFPTEKREVVREINSIVFKIVLLNHDHFFTSDEIKSSYRLIHNEIWRMNDTLVKLQSEDLIYEIYDIITDIITDILDVCKGVEYYERLKNIKDIFNYWISTLKYNNYLND